MEIIKPVLNIGIEILFMLVIADYAARVKLIVASGFMMSMFFIVTRLI
ncbi:hypothetical protein [Escherichia phage ULINTec6]|uniref:Uncharacterized protein n=1 Tax=Escherichia phage ULINTec6 TaxID=2876730 RepID=A0AAE9C0M9_9CAUD|nr:hypothetical protein [Escherichia phage ULINTec6]